MSLKAFHLCFILISILLAFGFGAWEVYAYTQTGTTVDLLLGMPSLIAGMGLIFYLRAFLKKLKNVDYL